MRTALRCAGVALIVASSVLFFLATPAAAADTCVAADFEGLAFSVDAEAPVTTVEALGQLTAGQVVTMTWNDLDATCDAAPVSLAVHRTDGSATRELVPGASSCAADCANTISLTVPSRTVACEATLIAAAAAPQLDLAGYDQALLGTTGVGPGDCAPASPSAFDAVLCGQGGVGLFLANNGEVDASFAIEVDGSPHAAVEVGPRSANGPTEAFRLIRIVEDQSARIMVAAEGRVLVDRLWKRNCFGQSAPPTIEPDCASGGGAVVLDNVTPEPLDYTIVIDGTEQKVTVGGNSMEKVRVDIAEGASSTVVVLAHDGAELARRTVARDCELPSASAAVACSQRAFAFSLSNDGLASTEIELMVNGAVVVSIPVLAGESIVSHLPAVEDAPATVAARSNGEVLFTASLTMNCAAAPVPTTTPSPTTVTPSPGAGQETPAPAEVLGVSLRRNTPSAPAVFTASDGTTQVLGISLAKTGSDTHVMVIAAGLLLTLGGFFLFQSGSQLERFELRAVRVRR